MLSVSLLSSCGGSSTTDPSIDHSNFSDLSLVSLTFSGGDIEPVFNKNYGGPYVLEVGKDVASVDVIAQTASSDVIMNIYKKGRSTDSDGNTTVAVLESVEVVSGEINTKTLTPGDNLIVVRIVSANRKNYFEYSVNVHRANEDASLLGLKVLNEGHVATDDAPVEYLTLKASDGIDGFNGAKLNYTASVACSGCTVSVSPRTVDRTTSVLINGLAAKHLTYTPLDLAIGVNDITVVSTAEVGDSPKTYSLQVTRQAGTTAELDGDTTLKSMSVSGAVMDRSFYCMSPTYTGVVNNDTASVLLTVQPSVEEANTDGDLPVVVVGSPTADANGQVIGVTDPISSVDGNPYSFDVPLEVGRSTVVIQVTSRDGNKQRLYVLYLERLTTNRVRVSSSEDLQAALQNAQANDEIVVAAGIYEGVASVDTSGSDSAHFYSAQSGTAEQRIILRSSDSSNEAVLIGADLTQASVLQLTGDNWYVRDLNFATAQTGVELLGASNVLFDSNTISDIGERGLIISQGGSDNQIRRNIIADTGMMPRASADTGGEVFGEAIVVGDSTELAEDQLLASNNQLRHNFVGPTGGAELIDLKVDSDQTFVQFNIVDVTAVSADAELGAAVVSRGNLANISYNSFYSETAPQQLTALIALEDVPTSFDSGDWGDSAKVYQNTARLAEAPVVFANGTNLSDVAVADNVSIDGATVSYIGDGINTSFTTPIYQLRSRAESPLCVMENTSDITDPDNDLAQVMMADCSDSSDQYWKFLNAGSGTLFLVPADDETRMMIPSSQSFYTSSSAVSMITIPFPSSSLLSASFIRWRLLYAGDYVSVLNRAQDAYVLTSSDEVGESFYINYFINSGLQQFELIEK